MAKRRSQLQPVLPQLVPGTMVIRLSPSKTGRAITPGMLGRMGGQNPALHDNPDSWTGYEFVPMQWQNGLWSNLEANDRQSTWDFYPRPDEATNEALEEAGR